jgi:phosphoribosylglycinamide formyltransferase-1
MERPLRFGLVASTAGGVLNEALKCASFRRHVHSLIVDCECPAIDRAAEHRVPVQRFLHDDPQVFCQHLLDYCRANAIDYLFTFYTKFYSKAFRDAYQDRIINFHPSILPAFKGMDGFGDQMAYHVRFIGATVEFIDQAMDEGKIIMQHLFPRDPALPAAAVRHRLFVQQCRSMVQVARWLCEDRIEVDGRRVTVKGARFDDPEFSPALDFDDAIRMTVPDPRPAP